MKLIFNIKYHTNWGESVYLTGNIATLGNDDYGKAIKLTPTDADNWTLELELPDGVDMFNYHYIVRHDNGNIRTEWGHGNRFYTTPGIHLYRIYDHWQDQPSDKPLYSAAFTDCICLHKNPGELVHPKDGFTTFSVAAPMVGPGRVVAICGSSKTLGGWDTSRALRMSDAEFPLWKVNVPSDGLTADTEYKFIILDSATGNVVAWEGYQNRVLGFTPSIHESTVLSGLRLRNTLQPWRGAGTAIPVFSLRTEADFGVGDFYDLKEMVDWAAESGQTFIQILPINDTTMTGTWTDSYPYNANSTFALHPMYLRLEEMGKLKSKKRRDYYAALAAELNALPTVDYERVNNGKNEYFREIFAQDGEATMKSAAFKDFKKRNLHWLLPYAAFCSLRDHFGTPDFTKWGSYAKYSKKVLDKVVKENAADIDMVCYIQYHLDKQMRHVHNYANSKGIALKGDIPIGISRTSADAWQDTRLFNMNSQAGAPPDDFSIMGQNWGFPTYNWDEMAKDGFAWWKARFGKMAEYFDAYRIDHVLGFFRIWQIPMDAVHGLLGYFNPALPFTADELLYNYDFRFNADLYTNPYIMESFLSDFFGANTEAVKEQFMESMGQGRYKLKKEFDTQRKVSDYFATQDNNDVNKRICEGLMSLIDDVLFIEDPVEKGKYHPRIAAQSTYIYRSLSDYEKGCFMRLYNDFFYHRHNDFWYGKAMWKLPPLINSTDMLVCAEDLGMIPACVPEVMKRLEILSLEIQRMPKDPNSHFGNTWFYPYYSVCTTSTHDMGGIRQWWGEDRATTQQYYNEVLHCQGEAPYFAEPWVCDKIVDLQLKSPSMLCILPLQDWLSIDGAIRRQDPREEQINVPANPRHYWRYRMHLTVKELASHHEFTSYLRTKIKESGRE